MGKRSQIRRQVFKNPKNWYTIGHSNNLWWHIQIKGALKLCNGWSPLTFPYSCQPYANTIQRALVDCGELIKKDVYVLKIERIGLNRDNIYKTRKRIVMPYGDVDKLSELIDEYNNRILQHSRSFDPTSIVKKRLSIIK
jgi:hypothetical protein